MAGPEDEELIEQLNGARLPAQVDSCLHEMVERQTVQRPDAEALCAWDLQLSYAQLDKAAADLARHIVNLGAGVPGTFIPVCFEKSGWAIVSMIAVMKAGAGFVPLDPTHPIERRVEIIEEVGAKVILASPDAAPAFDGLVGDAKVVVVSPSLMELLAAEPRAQIQAVTPVQPTDVAYAYFTSGSTGKPKGVVMEHRSICSGLAAQAPAVRITSSTRALNFSAFVFDACLLEIFGTLTQGGCLVVPSDSIRMNGLAQFMNDTETNFAIFTPTFATTMRPEDVPGLRVLVLGGEAVRKENLDTWLPAVEVINAYGPTESCIAVVFHSFTAPDQATIIGRAEGAVAWIADPDDYNRLAPVGCAGELLIQGPSLAREYLNDKAKTDGAFVEPAWLKKNRSKLPPRVYRTGDLVRYTAEGTIEYMGRRDSQIKLRGQRLEPGEIEYQVKRSLGGDNVQVSVNLLKGATAASAANLAAFICFDPSAATTSGDDGLLLPMDEAAVEKIQELVRTLAKVLPEYMVPTMFFPVRQMPMATSGKTDARRLKRAALALTHEQLKQYLLSSVGDGAKRPPQTGMEIKLQGLWAATIGIPLEEIGLDDSFLQVGGDSVSAIRLVTNARAEGVHSLTVATIFSSPRLEDMARECEALQASEEEEEEAIAAQAAERKRPFGLLPDDISPERVREAVTEQCGIASPALSIEDAYQSTALQEGMITLTEKEAGTYVAQNVFRLGAAADVGRFKSAWESVVAAVKILRTRLLSINERCMQVVLNEDVTWHTAATLEEYLAHEKALSMHYGSPLSRYGLITEGDETFFVWSIHHAVYDGWSMALIKDALMGAYYHGAPPSDGAAPYADFVAYTLSIPREETEEYWRSELADCKKTNFPRLTNLAKKPRTDEAIRRSIALPAKQLGRGITKASLMRAAWAIVVARNAGVDDVVFGTTVSGRNAPVAGIEGIIGPAIATMPVRVRLGDGSMPTSHFLKAVQAQSNQLIPYEQFGLQNISKLSSDAREACDFQTLLAIHPPQTMATSDEAEPFLHQLNQDDSAEKTFFTYALVFQCHLSEGDEMQVTATYDSSILQSSQIDRLVSQFSHVANQLIEASSRPVASLDLVSPHELQQLRAWNSEDEPEIVESCVHHLVQRQAALRPEAPAIRAWDGVFTYGALDAAANRLAHHLVSNVGVQVDQLVPVCFEKSAWFFVAILAICKAGGAWVPLDPSHPESRQRQVVQQTRARLALASPANFDRCSSLVETVVQVSPALDEQLAATNPDASSHPPACDVSPRNAAYVLFTSGSTGAPKGIVMEHASVCTSQTAISKRLGLTPEVRILQFASYVFDFCIGEIVASLISGACVCVPSEYMRINGLKQFVRDMDINWLFLTPAFTRTLKPEDVPGVELLLLGGEAVGQDILDTWFGKVRLINGWGPTETCVVSTLHEWASPTESPLTIGRPVGGKVWIVEPDNPQRLVPAGCIGEVVIQGPTMLREYLSDPERTAAATVTALPEWAPKRTSRGWDRFYKSGDLCFYNADGTIEFVSRKDTQVKIRGLRVELGDVEHHVRATLEGVKQVVVDVFETGAGSTLIAFFCLSTDTRAQEDVNDADVFLPLTEELESKVTAAVGQLNVTLPRYMIPTVFVPTRYMPLVTSSKLDRNRLRSLAAALPTQQLAMYSLAQTKKREPATDMEARLQKIWADILHVSPDTIGRDDSFLQLGGDSIAAIQLVTLARDHGISLAVSDIFDDPRLTAVARAASLVDQDEALPHALEPWGMLAHMDLEAVQSHIRDQCNLSSDQVIQDAYPCTKLQEGMMALAVKQPGSHIANYVYEIPAHVDVARFQRAWEETVRLCDNLRTRIVLFNGVSIQAVLQDDICWQPASGKTIHAYMESEQKAQMQYGSALCRYALVQDPRDGANYFVWTMHHAVYDGWSMRLMLERLQRIYQDTDVPAVVPYAGFINYTANLDIDAASAFWKDQLRAAKRAAFPRMQKKSQTSTSASLSRDIVFPRNTGSSVTKATILRAAWSLVLARYSDSDDVCFGASISGRQAAVPGIENMAGPVIATIPVRVRLDRRTPVSKFLEDIQAQASDMVPHEQLGLQNIAKLGPDAREACDFSSLLVIQPAQVLELDGAREGSILIPSTDAAFAPETANYFTYPLVVQGHISDERVGLHLVYDPAVLSEGQLEALAHQFEHVVRQLLLASQALNDNEKTIADVSLAGPFDLQRAASFNGPVVPVQHTTFHALVDKQARERPHAPAIHAWDGEFTYAQLASASDRLARHLLATTDIRPDYLVPICFEKTAWTYVAMLAVNKAGGAWVPLDPSHPDARRREILEQTGASFMLAGEAATAKCGGLGAKRIVVVGRALDAELSEQQAAPAGPLPSIAGPQHAVYVLFTSGSTGKPKGIVMEHRNACTSQLEMARWLGLSAGVRMLQFASHVFDMSIGEIIGPLISGACLCVPSERDRMNDVPGFIERANVNWVFFTPSFVRLLSPHDIPSVTTVLVAGEAVGYDNLEKWVGKVRFVNGWGPSETCVCSSLHEWTQVEGSSPLTVGKPLACNLWVVEPDDHKRLAPVGCVGEIYVQGPTISREYFMDDEKTKATYIDDIPDWAPRLGAGEDAHSSRFYKTGDLGYWNPDGTLEFVGRIDTQVKIRGFRIELGEIEHNIRKSLAGVEQVGVDVVKTDDGSNPTLVAYLCFSEESRTAADDISDIFAPADEPLKAALASLVDDLKAALPPYMVPTLFLPLSYMPFITSTKLDRNRLSALVAGMSRDELAAFSLDNQEKVAPTTAMEVQLRDLWAQVLKVAPESIGRNDSFLQIGGDSITAIQLVTVARNQGVGLSVAQIFADPRLGRMAAVAQSELTAESTFETEPFGLLPAGTRDVVVAEAAKQCRVDAGKILDAFPCTPLQEGLIALAEKQPGSYMARFVMQIPRGLDMARFKAALETTTSVCTNLRTRIVLSSGQGPRQVILDEDVAWREQSEESLGQFLKKPALTMGYGTPLSLFTLVRDQICTYFVWDIHHSMYDGWALSRMVEVLQRAYYQEDLPEPVPYANYVNYTLASGEAEARAFWTAQLDGAHNMAKFPKAPADLPDVRSDRTMSQWMAVPEARNAGDVTTPTLLRAAYAFVLAKYLESNDVVFGSTVSGRNAPVPGIDRILGLTIGTIPVRVRIDRTQTAAQYLAAVQRQSNDMIPFEHTGLQVISHFGEGCRAACDFHNLLIIQPGFSNDFSRDMGLKLVDMTAENENYHVYPLVFQCSLEDKGQIRLHATYDSRVLSEAQIQAMMNQFEHVVGQLAGGGDAVRLADVSLCGPRDIEQIWDWNTQELPETTSACAHDLIALHAACAPKREAICSWEGSITYADLDQLSSQLANHLFQLGVRPETPVPICFEKSMWTIVAMLGIMKAGGAFIPLDPSHPTARRQEIVKETKAQFMIVSPSAAAGCAGMAEHVLPLSASLMAWFPKTANHGMKQRSKPAPSNAAYTIFTSGSTGKPKGVTVEHAALCSSIMGHGRAYGLSPSSRVLQFSNYVFDVSLGEIFSTLVFGGCVCVPSDDARLRNIAGFINEARVNTAMLTPSFARTFVPDEVPTLQTLILGGEPLAKDNLLTWTDRVRLINGYGPAEATIYCSTYVFDSADESPTIIGRGANATCWIVEPDDHHALAPIGCVGELLVQGPALARGYMNDVDRTRDSFIDDVAWLPLRAAGQAPRFYKTGDLVRYRVADGAIEYVGRKDTQVKLRGQRIELGEIEFGVKNVAEVDVAQVVVDLIRSQGGEALVAFVSFESVAQQERDGTDKRASMHAKRSSVSSIASIRSTRSNKSGSIRSAADISPLLPMDDELRSKLAGLANSVAATLPAHMTPQYFVPMRRIPETSSGKLDRKTLREMATNMAAEELSAYGIGGGSAPSAFRAPVTKLQTAVRKLWAQVLNMPEDKIGIDDNFYHLGGDSIRIITLGKLIRKEFDVTLGLAQLSSKNTTVSGLADFVRRARSGSALREQEEPKVDLLKELNALSISPLSKELLAHPTSTLPMGGATVLLTGATGFLGTHILEKLLHDDRVAHVIALVRAASPRHGLERVRKTAHIAGWWSVGDAAKLTIWVGDLSHTKLGLNDKQWDVLSTGVDAIVHNGAVVNWNADFDRLKAANAEATRDLLNAAASSPAHPRFVYVGGGVKGVDTLSDLPAAAKMLGAHGTGYVQTKFLSEALVHGVAKELDSYHRHHQHIRPQTPRSPRSPLSLLHSSPGSPRHPPQHHRHQSRSELPQRQNRISTVKPGLVVGAADTGVANLDDFVWRLVAASARLRAFPAEPRTHWLYLADAHSVAQAVVSQLFLPSAAAFVDIATGMTVPAFWETVMAGLGVDGESVGEGGVGRWQEVEWREWMQRAQEDLDEVGEQHPLYPVQHFLGRLGSAETPQDWVEGCDEEDGLKRAVRRNLEYLVDVGFVEGTALQPRLARERSGSVIRRSETARF
ncbi:non-ribosomal peptide synthetase [Macrophomina phaseolina]|uniref:Non-ribosomal peptide synthetase n=1 Tax=Macrophomina phaseolina TaxID=35725 RepID=A0ABQ8G2L5_9PEZI|nr:non-ribosomal peptide synthetase [Macrophomina phaseolina]